MPPCEAGDSGRKLLSAAIPDASGLYPPPPRNTPTFLRRNAPVLRRRAGFTGRTRRLPRRGAGGTTSGHGPGDAGPRRPQAVSRTSAARSTCSGTMSKPIAYISKIRDNHARLGDRPYEWVRNEDGPPWRPFAGPPGECRVGLKRALADAIIGEENARVGISRGKTSSCFAERKEATEKESTQLLRGHTASRWPVGSLFGEVSCVPGSYRRRRVPDRRESEAAMSMMSREVSSPTSQRF